MANKNLQAAKSAKKDEFYTQLSDIEKELRHYKEHFRGKTVLCNCDDPRISNFFKYFAMNFEHLGLKRLITTCYKNQDIDLFSNHSDEKAVYLIYDGDTNGNGYPDAEEIGIHPLKGDGDFRSNECIELLKQADIVVTNPPFSLFREYVAQLMKYEKKFLIIGNIDNTTYREVFPLLKDNKIWLGYNSGSYKFNIPEFYEGNNIKIIDGERKACFGNICWYTNLEISKRHEDLVLYKKYESSRYPKYDNYDAIEVCQLDNIPDDYYGVMGLSITFFTKYCPDQFEVIGITDRADDYGLKTKKYTKKDTPRYSDLNGRSVLLVNGEYKKTYPRVLIRRKIKNKL